jgi:hypothetical protein
MNAQGGDIYFRPVDGPELLLVDALSAEGCEGDVHKRIPDYVRSSELCHAC